MHKLKEVGRQPDSESLGLLPSGPDPVGEGLVHRQPPSAYFSHLVTKLQAIFKKTFSFLSGRLIGLYFKRMSCGMGGLYMYLKFSLRLKRSSILQEPVEHFARLGVLQHLHKTLWR